MFFGSEEKTQREGRQEQGAMSGKTNNTTSKGLPKFREKLSNLVRQTSLRGSAKKLAKPGSDATPEPQPSKQRVKRRDKAPLPVKTDDKLLGDFNLGEFKPFDIDLATLEAFRLSEGWLEGQGREQPSSTPIADTFSRNSIQIEPTTGIYEGRSGSKTVELPAVESRIPYASAAPHRGDSHVAGVNSNFAQTRAAEFPQTTQAKHNVTVPSRASSLRREIGSLDEAMKAPPRHQVKEVSLLKPVGYSETPSALRVSRTIEQLNANKRYSMPASLPSELGTRRSVADIKDSLAPRSTSNPKDRRLSLQPSPPASTTSASSSSQHTLTRRTSTRLASDRLAWIKELEEGKNGNRNPGRDFVLKNLQGGVADKLAKFEGKQLTGGLTRTNSTISRISSADAYGIESSYGSIMTRTSTVDTSNRASSVLTNFDDSFREKMESLAGSLVSKANEETAGEEKSLSRVTSKLIPVVAPKEQPEETNKQELPKEVTDFAMLSDGDPETIINDITRHAPGLGRTLTWNETDIVAQINDAADRALTELPESKTNLKTPIDTVSKAPAPTPVSTKPTTITDYPSAPSPSPSSPESSPPRKTKNANMSIRVSSAKSSIAPATPTRITMGINSPPCAATFSTLSSEAIPLAKDEMTPATPVTPKKMSTGSVPETEGFTAATLPVIAQG